MHTLASRFQTYHEIATRLDALEGVALVNYQGGLIPNGGDYHSEWKPHIDLLKRSIGEVDEPSFFPIWNLFLVDVHHRRSLLHPFRGESAITLADLALLLEKDFQITDPDLVEGDVIPRAFFSPVKDKSPVGYSQRMIYHQGFVGQFETGEKESTVLLETIAFATTRDTAIWGLKRGPPFEALSDDAQTLYYKLIGMGTSPVPKKSPRCKADKTESAGPERSGGARSDRDPTVSSAYAENDWSAY